MKKKKKRSKAKKNRISLRQIYTEALPPPIAARISPLLTIGAVALLLAVTTLVVPSTRGLAPFLALIALTLLGYGTWQRYDVISRGYKEILFKVVDYTFLTRLSRNPTGLIMIKADPETENDRGEYHIAVSGKEALPRPGWLVNVYVPSDIEPAEYSRRKYFPTVYGYTAIDSDDTEYQSR